MKTDRKILEVKHLKTYFYSDSGTVKAADDVSFFVNEGETLGIVGESGCGKSITCMSIIRLVETPPGKYEGGEILFDGKDMLKISDEMCIRDRLCCRLPGQSWPKPPAWQDWQPPVWPAWG